MQSFHAIYEYDREMQLRRVTVINRHSERKIVVVGSKEMLFFKRQVCWGIRHFFQPMTGGRKSERKTSKCDQLLQCLYYDAENDFLFFPWFPQRKSHNARAPEMLDLASMFHVQNAPFCYSCIQQSIALKCQLETFSLWYGEGLCQKTQTTSCKWTKMLDSLDGSLFFYSFFSVLLFSFHSSFSFAHWVGNDITRPTVKGQKIIDSITTGRSMNLKGSCQVSDECYSFLFPNLRTYSTIQAPPPGSLQQMKRIDLISYVNSAASLSVFCFPCLRWIALCLSFSWLVVVLQLWAEPWERHTNSRQEGCSLSSCSFLSSSSSCQS